MKNQKRLQQLDRLLDEIEVYGRCIGKMGFDMSCCAPEEGLAQAGDDMAVLGKRVYELTHSARYTALLTALYEDRASLPEIRRAAVEHLYRSFAREKNLTAEQAFEMDTVLNRAYGDWLRAKKANDFSQFRDSFAAVIACTRQAVLARDEQKPTVYDALLDDFEPGGNIAQLDAFFDALKARILPLIRRIQTEGKPVRTDFLSRPVPIPQQEALSRRLLQLQGLRPSALVLMTTEHPFTDHYGPNDVRVTTHYYENNFISNIFSTLHEGGHALFMQNEPKTLYEQHAADHMTSAMHECISRFYENVIGRSRAFVSYALPLLREYAGDTFADVTEEELYRAVNAAKPGLIRMEADELTYCVHILIRYELEKLFVNREIGVDEVPALWNAKYKEYLGLDVPDDAQGCLQDVHWTGSYGYFPSYALGSAYGAQILRAMEKEFDVFDAVGKGDLKPIGDWLTERAFPIASLRTPEQWIREITGEAPDPACFLDYLEKKFTAIYFE